MLSPIEKNAMAVCIGQRLDEDPEIFQVWRMRLRQSEVTRNPQMVDVSQAGWSASSAAALVASVGLLISFVYIESPAPAPLIPLIPLSLFKLRNLAVASIADALLVTALLARRPFEASHLQLIMQLTHLQVGLALLATENVTFGMLLMGLGMGLAHNPILLSAMRDINLTEAGAASGIITTAVTMGGGLGLSVLGGIAAAHTNALLASGVTHQVALNSGYQRAFWTAAIAVAIAALLAAFRLRDENE